jgi:peptide/nickel transport system substrate-binding protein
MSNYWDKVLQRRLSRRRAIVATGALGASAAFLAACGSDDGGGGGTGGDSSGLLYDRQDETSGAKPGGVYVDSHPLVLTTFDPMRTGGQIRVARRGYSQLFRVADGTLEIPDGSVEGDLAESWELSPDKLTLTVKLYPQAGFPPIPPVNGRMVDSDDVLFTWQRVLDSGNLRGELANSVNSAAPITSVTAADKQTVVIKMAQPDVTIFQNLATDVLGGMYVLPKEAADPNVIDIPRKAIGTGPYYLSNDSEIEYDWKKNPNFKRPKLTNGEPFIDEIHEPVITDPAAGSAQFRSGALYEYPISVNEILGAKRENPDLLMSATSPTTFTERLFFGQSADSPFKDERVRIAFMKSIDRDAFIDVAYNADQFKKEGLPVDTFWEGALRASTYKGWYVDPSDASKFGDAGSNYVYDPEEAKKLIEAAGFSTPLAFNNTYGAPSPTSFPASYYTRAEIFLGMIESSNLWKQNRVLIDYRTEWNTDRYRFSLGNFNGTSWGSDTSPVEATSAMFFVFNSKGGLYLGGDATLDDLTARAKQEFDDAKRKDLIAQVQKYDAQKFYNEKIGVAGSFALHWPVVRNFNVHFGGTNWLGVTTPSGLKAWLDPTKRPIA